MTSERPSGGSQHSLHFTTCAQTELAKEAGLDVVLRCMSQRCTVHTKTSDVLCSLQLATILNLNNIFNIHSSPSCYHPSDTVLVVLHWRNTLTVSTSGSALKHKPVGYRSISAQVREVPVADNDRRDVAGEGQQVVAQMKSGRSALQFSPREHSHTEPVN